VYTDLPESGPLPPNFIELIDGRMTLRKDKGGSAGACNEDRVDLKVTKRLCLILEGILEQRAYTT